MIANTYMIKKCVRELSDKLKCAFKHRRKERTWLAYNLLGQRESSNARYPDCNAHAVL